MRHDPTEAEDLLWGALRGRLLIGSKFRRQVPVGAYIADFVCPEAMLTSRSTAVDTGIRTTMANGPLP